MPRGVQGKWLKINGLAKWSCTVRQDCRPYIGSGDFLPSFGQGDGPHRPLAVKGSVCQSIRPGDCNITFAALDIAESKCHIDGPASESGRGLPRHATRTH